jgi:hypothetical protein
MVRKYERLREAAYEEGRREFDELDADPTFREFVCLYVGEGYKRNRNTVSLSNSNPAVMRLAIHWLRRLSARNVFAHVQYHADQDPVRLCAFWGEELSLSPAAIRKLPKTNSAQLRHRIWRCRHGVVTVGVNDTCLRARLQAWMDRLEQGWRELDSPVDGA